MKAIRNLKLVAIALLVLFALGTTGFHLIEGWSWFDSFYMVLTTVTTIGYSEVHPLSPTGRIFNVFLIVIGVGLVFLLIGAVAQALLEFELTHFFGRRRMEREIDRLSGHFIICGAGRVGRSTARELALKPVPFVIIENAAVKMEPLPPEWLTIRGDATQETTLRQAHIERARGLVAATTTDATNIYIVLTARGLNPKLKIIARASEEDAEKHLKTAGADSVISPYHFAGHRIAQSFLRPHVLDFIDSATVRLGVDLEIAEIEMAAAFALCRADVSHLEDAPRHRHHRARHQARGLHALQSRPDDRIEAGDTLIAMGEAAGLRKLEEAAGMPTL